MDDSQNTQQTTGLQDDQAQKNAASLTGMPQQPSEKKDETIAVSGGYSKEGGASAPFFSEQLVSASNPEIEISSELHDKGVEALSEIPQLTPEDAYAGIVHAKESTPVSTVPVSTISLPMTQQQAQQTVKIHKKVKDSFFWFAMLILRQWQVAQKDKKKERR